MKKITLVLLFFVMPEYIFAANYGHTGTISRIVSVPAGADRDYILVDGFQSAGSCPVTSGLVIAKFPSGEAGNRSYALAMGKRRSGHSIDGLVVMVLEVFGASVSRADVQRSRAAGGRQWFWWWRRRA